VEATIEDHVGWYVVALSISTGPYQRAFAQLLDSLRTATAGDATTSQRGR